MWLTLGRVLSRSGPIAVRLRFPEVKRKGEGAKSLLPPSPRFFLSLRSHLTQLHPQHQRILKQQQQQGRPRRCSLEETQD